MTLQQEIEKMRAEIRTDGYPISIGEWISLYEKKEIDIHPEFQRFFRWTPIQKSRLIESILLGIPIPPIFVAQRDDGVWDVVDGLQRLSTLFQFMGILRDENENITPALVLEETKYLPSLKGKKWEDPNDADNSFSQALRLQIKRSKIDVSIILKESDDMAKFELFQRLNTGGSPLSDQEVRNSILVMLNRDMFTWIKNLSEDTNFMECVALTDRATEEQYDLELVLRFLVFRSLPEQELAFGDVGDFITDKMRVMALNKDYDYAQEERAFRRTFEILANTIRTDSFKRYDRNRERFVGGFVVSAYEAVALGIGRNYDRVDLNTDELRDIVRDLWSNPNFTNYSGGGVRASTRVPRIITLGRQIFSQ